MPVVARPGGRTRRKAGGVDLLGSDMVGGDWPVERLRVHKEHIVAGLRGLGLGAGTRVMVHSSLRSFGHVEGGARTVIAALMEVITPAGTLMMPSFNHGRAFADDAPGYFAPHETPTTNGAVPDLFWRLPGVYRSLNPTHSFAAWGRDARRYTAFHHRTLTMGPDSPLGMLHRDGGYCLLIGVGYRANTFHHVVEMSTGAPCLGLRTQAYPMLLPDGRWVEGRSWGYRERPCPFTDGGMYVDDMQERGLHREILVGTSRLVLFRLKDCFTVIADLLREGRAGHPPCSRCPTRPAVDGYTVPSDWDWERGCLLPDSPAWQY